jgi:hypothetical protein
LISDYEDLTQEEQDEIVNDTKIIVFGITDGEEVLLMCITNNTGWCIKSLPMMKLN